MPGYEEMEELTEEQEKRFIGVFINSRYQVSWYEYDSPWGPLIWLAIVNKDRSARHDWRDFQRIKNELVGPEYEAFEMYPAESRLVDTNNQYHLFVLEKGKAFPIGFAAREVGDEQLPGSAHKQRPFENPPDDLNASEYKGKVWPVYGPPSSDPTDEGSNDYGEEHGTEHREDDYGP